MIEINGVNKKFSTTAALNNVIAAVQEKSIFGLVGTNGAGKSTLLRIISSVSILFLSGFPPVKG